MSHSVHLQQSWTDYLNPNSFMVRRKVNRFHSLGLHTAFSAITSLPNDLSCEKSFGPKSFVSVAILWMRKKWEKKTKRSINTLECYKNMLLNATKFILNQRGESASVPHIIYTHLFPCLYRFGWSTFFL